MHAPVHVPSLQPQGPRLKVGMVMAASQDCVRTECDHMITLEKAALSVEHLATYGSAAECSAQGINYLKSQGPKA